MCKKLKLQQIILWFLRNAYKMNLLLVLSKLKKKKKRQKSVSYQLTCIEGLGSILQLYYFQTFCHTGCISWHTYTNRGKDT